MTKTNVRIALAQTFPDGQELNPPAEQMQERGPFYIIDQNLKETHRLVKAAAGQGADVVVFPEFWLQDLVGQGRQYLSYPHQHIVAVLQDMAKQSRIAIVGSIACGAPLALKSPIPSGSPFNHILHGEEANDRLTSNQLEWMQWVKQHPVPPEYKTGHEEYPLLHNTAIFVDDDGKVLGRYSKRNLWHPERDYFAFGSEPNKVFETKFGRVGMLICWDLSHPSAGQELSDQDVDLVLVPAYWMATDSYPQMTYWPHVKDYEKSIVHSWMFARAVETESVWALCNVGGVADERMGGSGVWAPLRGKIDGFEDAEPGLKVVEVDMEVLKDTKEVYKIRDDYARYREMMEGWENTGKKRKNVTNGKSSYSSIHTA